MSDVYLERFRRELRRLGIDGRNVDRIATEVDDHISEAAAKETGLELDALMGTPSDLAQQFQDVLWTRALQRAQRMLQVIGGMALAIVTAGEGTFGLTNSWPTSAHSTRFGVTTMSIGLTLAMAAALLMVHSRPGFGRTRCQWKIVRALHLTSLAGTALILLGLGLWTAAQAGSPLWWIIGLSGSAAALIVSATIVLRLSTRLGALAASQLGPDDETLSRALSDFWRPPTPVTPQEQPLVLASDLTLVPADAGFAARSRWSDTRQKFFRKHPWIGATLLIPTPLVYGYLCIAPFSKQAGGDAGLAFVVIGLAGASTELVKQQLSRRRDHEADAP